MLGIVFLYIIGKYFFKLAEKFNQKKWLFAILGVASYYFGSIVIGGVLLGISLELIMPSGIDTFSDFALGLMLIPFGIATTYLFYYLLKKKWEKSVVVVKDEIQDIGKSQESNEQFPSL
jgi:predicted membrane protein